MKKEYIKPEMQVCEVATQQLLDGSLEPESNLNIWADDAPEDDNDDML